MKNNKSNFNDIDQFLEAINTPGKILREFIGVNQ